MAPNAQTTGMPAPPPAPPPTDMPITSVPDSGKDRFGGVLAGILKAAGGDTGSLEKSLQQHNDQRLAEARMHQQHTALYATILATAHRTVSAQAPYGIDPTTNTPMTKEQYDYYTQAYQTSMSAYEKAAGTNKQSKGILAQAKMLMQHVVGQPPQAAGAGAGGAAPPQTGMPAPPAAPPSMAVSRNGQQGTLQSASTLPVPITRNGESGMLKPVSMVTPAASSGASAPPASAPAASAALAAPSFPEPPPSMLQHDMEAQEEKRKLDEASARKIAEEKAKPQALKTMERHVPGSSLPPGTMTIDGQPPDPDKTYDLIQTGDPNNPYVAGPSGATAAELTPKFFNYVGLDGKPHRGFTVGGPGNMQAYGIGSDGKDVALHMDPEVFSAWMAPRTTITQGFKSVMQPDGSEKLIPVETSSTQSRGAIPTSAPPPPPAPKSSTPSAKAGGPPATAPAKSSAAPKSGGGGGARILGPGVTVGGKVPPGVAKAYDKYNGAVERYQVMKDSYARAKADPTDQQAQLNLLANHIGMTMGLQQGARITQAIYNEAMGSVSWGAGIEAHFTGPPDPVTGEPTLDLNPLHYKKGVVLTQKQMDQMMPLAEKRLKEDKAAWEREVAAAKTGYGMMEPPPPPAGAAPPAAASAPAAPGAPPKTADEYLLKLRGGAGAPANP
jgi:hypothetical protein